MTSQQSFKGGFRWLLFTCTLPVLMMITTARANALPQTTIKYAESSSTSASASTSPTSSTVASVSTAESSESATPRVHVITVAKAAHAFNPETITAAVGDTVRFEFYPANHSVVRSNYENPCVPYEYTEPGEVGFFSGFHAPQVISSNPETWTLLINDSKPIFFYCSATGSCNKWGMSGAINPNISTPYITYKEKAKKASFQLSPGEPFPSESDTTTTSSSTKSPSSAIDNTANPKTPLAAGTIAGIAVGCSITVALIVILLVVVFKRRTPKVLPTPSAAVGAAGGGGVGAGAALPGYMEPIKTYTAGTMGEYQDPRYSAQSSVFSSPPPPPSPGNVFEYPYHQGQMGSAGWVPYGQPSGTPVPAQQTHAVEMPASDERRY